jgi:hypothetical protein
VWMSGADFVGWMNGVPPELHAEGAHGLLESFGYLLSAPTGMPGLRAGI